MPRTLTRESISSPAGIRSFTVSAPEASASATRRIVAMRVAGPRSTSCPCAAIWAAVGKRPLSPHSCRTRFPVTVRAAAIEICCPMRVRNRDSCGSRLPGSRMPGEAATAEASAGSPPRWASTCAGVGVEVQQPPDAVQQRRQLGLVVQGGGAQHAGRTLQRQFDVGVAGRCRPASAPGGGIRCRRRPRFPGRRARRGTGTLQRRRTAPSVVSTVLVPTPPFCRPLPYPSAAHPSRPRFTEFLYPAGLLPGRDGCRDDRNSVKRGDRGGPAGIG